MPIALILAAALSAVPFERAIRDWIVVCDNVRSCTMKAVPDDLGDHPPAHTGLGFSITRDAGPKGAPKVSIWKQDKIDARALRVDGRFFAARWTSDEESLSLAGPEALAFLRMLREAHELTEGAAKDAAGASLAGFAAVLLAADEAQGRIGTAGALARPGAAPDAAVPPPPPLPVVTAAPPPPPLTDAKRLAAAVRRTRAADLKAQDCDAERADDDDAQPLNAREAVVILGCIMGAYQGSQLAYRVSRTAPASATPLDLPLPPGLKRSEGDDGRLHTMADYNPKAAEFSESGKGRGIGDCGDSTTWTFDGRRFVPSARTSQERCGGEDADWPTIYRTRAVRGR